MTDGSRMDPMSRGVLLGSAAVAILAVGATGLFDSRGVVVRGPGMKDREQVCHA